MVTNKLEVMKCAEEHRHDVASICEQISSVKNEIKLLMEQNPFTESCMDGVIELYDKVSFYQSVLVYIWMYYNEA